ncbi:hypothetical protein Hypma_012572 [Hypsizygus marmoreus]|uniref:Uncharacterized protein n=1 Tax=Hypsizygus marmoreus TaxID=39966 RepID=A0A369JKX7_HYPMA|nr:hypothetical protein Hypma_012572 [Hypsizygus marmoreus]
MLASCLGEAVAGPTYRSLTPASGRVLVDRASATAAVLTEFTDSDSFTFSVYIIDHDDFKDEFSIPAPVVPSNITALSIRRPASRVCSWYYACVNAAVYTASISANQAAAVKNAINARLRANNNELMKLLVQGIGLTFSTSDKSIAADVCVIYDDWKQRIAQIQADIEKVKKAIQSGDSRPRTFVHVSTEQTQGVDGQTVAHEVKATQVSNDFQPPHMLNVFLLFDFVLALKFVGLISVSLV